MNEDIPSVVTGNGPRRVEAFDAKVVDLGDGTCEIRLRHKGRDVAMTLLREGLLDPLFELARKVIANPPNTKSLDTAFDARETVVPVLRGPDGRRKN